MVIPTPLHHYLVPVPSVLSSSISESLPNIYGSFRGGRSTGQGNSFTGCVIRGSGSYDTYSSGSYDMYTVAIDASSYNSVYREDSSVTPLSLEILFFIRY